MDTLNFRKKITLISTQYNLNTTGTMFLEDMKKINGTCRTWYKDLEQLTLSVYTSVFCIFFVSS